MSDHSITSLIEKLEGGPVYLTHKEAYDLAIWFGSDTALGLAQLIRKAFVGGSLDAALALAERVLPGWWWTTGRCGLTCHASVGPDSKFIEEPDLSKFDSGFHADVPNPSTPAIALCIAILRAHSEVRV